VVVLAKGICWVTGSFARRWRIVVHRSSALDRVHELYRLLRTRGVHADPRPFGDRLPRAFRWWWVSSLWDRARRLVGNDQSSRTLSVADGRTFADSLTGTLDQARGRSRRREGRWFRPASLRDDRESGAKRGEAGEGNDDLEFHEFRSGVRLDGNTESVSAIPAERLTVLSVVWGKVPWWPRFAERTKTTEPVPANRRGHEDYLPCERDFA
jgi:hypothetical protein